MTEAEWLACTDPTPMLKFLRDKSSDRKVRLFAVACCRRIPSLFPDESSQKALDLLERFSDGRAKAEEFWSLLNMKAAEIGGERMSQVLVMGIPAWWRITMALQEIRPEVVTKLTVELLRHAKKGESIFQSYLLQCIFGNPFHQIFQDPAWLTPAVKGVAQAIYDERAFDRLAILADALEDAGCNDGDILNHCRQPKQHVRGCWVIDLVLDKK
jgi:hypothetical protein